MRNSVEWILFACTLISCASYNNQDKELMTLPVKMTFPVNVNDSKLDYQDVFIVGYESLPGKSYYQVRKNNEVISRLFEKAGLVFDALITDMVIYNSDIYLVGFENTPDFNENGYRNAFYIKNDVKHSLGIDGKNTVATQIFINNGDLYICGYEYFYHWENKNHDVYSTAVYWKNGTKYALTNGKTKAYAKGIAINNGDVIIIGKEDGIAKYWINETSFQLNEDKYKNIELTSVFVFNNDFYFCGFSSSENEYTDNRGKITRRTIAQYYKNGVSYNVSDGNYDAVAYDVFVNGNGVYVVGTEETGRKLKPSLFNDSDASDDFAEWWQLNYEWQHEPIAKLWINGEGYNLTEKDNWGEADRILIHDDNEYITGLSMNNTMLWRNKNPIILNDEKSDSAYSIIALDYDNNDIYYLEIVVEGQKSIAKLWNNNEVLSISDGTDFVESPSVFIDQNEVLVLKNWRKIDGFDALQTWRNIDGFEQIRYWENGQLVTVTQKDNNYCYYGKKIYKKGNDIYIIGSMENIYDDTAIPQNAIYWKNSELHYLEVEDRNAICETYDILVHKDDLYILGKIDNKILIWKNDKIFKILMEYDNEREIFDFYKKMFFDDNNIIIYLRGSISDKDYKNSMNFVKTFKNFEDINLFEIAKYRILNSKTHWTDFSVYNDYIVLINRIGNRVSFYKNNKLIDTIVLNDFEFVSDVFIR